MSEGPGEITKPPVGVPFVDKVTGALSQAAQAWFGSLGPPVGSTVVWWTATPPPRHVFCNGDTVGNEGSGATHSGQAFRKLFDYLLGVPPNTGAESWAAGNTVVLPDIGGRFPLGKAAAGTGSVLAGTGGSLGHTHTGPSHTHTTGDHALSAAELAAHRHGVNFYNGSPTADLDTTNHLARRTGGGNWYATALSDASVNDGADAIVRSAGSGTAHNHGATGAAGTGATGGADPAFIAVNWAMRY